MPYLTWDKLTFKQKIQVRMLRMHWKPEEFHDFEFFITKEGNASRGKGSHKLTDAACQRQIDKIAGIDIYHAEKGDLHLWGPGHSFTFIRD